MRKLFISLITTLFLFSPALASNVEIIPTMQSRVYSPDRVWVGTFQIVWNDFMDKIVHNPIRFPEGTPAYVKDLNAQSFTVEDFSDKSYYKYFGKVTKRTRREILSSIKRKFKENSDIIEKIDLTPSHDRYLIYTMLKKNFEFKSSFDKLGKSAFRTQSAEFFGINKSSSEELNNNVTVLFYNSSRDFAVKLETNSKDEVYLYRTAASKPFSYIYSDMLKKQALYKGETRFEECDELKIPNLSFVSEKSYDDISNKRIMGSNFLLLRSSNDIRAAMSVRKTSLTNPDNYRYFFFDNTFVLFIKEKNKQKPYFALRVHNIENFQ